MESRAVRVLSHHRPPRPLMRFWFVAAARPAAVEGPPGPAGLTPTHEVARMHTHVYLCGYTEKERRQGGLF